MKHDHHVPESCLRHCIEGVFEVDGNSTRIDSLFLSVGFTDLSLTALGADHRPAHLD